MGESLFRSSASWVLVSSESDGWGSWKNRRFDGLTKKIPMQQVREVPGIPSR